MQVCFFFFFPSFPGFQRPQQHHGRFVLNLGRRPRMPLDSLSTRLLLWVWEDGSGSNDPGADASFTSESFVRFSSGDPLFIPCSFFSVFQEGKSIVVPLCSYERGTQLTRGHMANNGLQRRQRRCSRLWQDKREGRTPSNRQTALGPCLGRLSSAIIRSAPLEPNSH